MALEVEIWGKTIQEKLLEDNTFLQHIADVDDSNIINGHIVHLPQAGAPSAVVKNRTVVPAVPQKRIDTEVLYLIDEYTTDPVYIPNAETKELSYDKRRSVLDQDIANLSEEVAEGMLLNMRLSPTGDNQALPTANILETQSAIAVAPGNDGATGQRKAYAINDLQRMRSLLKKQKAWSEGNMYALLTPEAEAQMFPADSIVTATYMQGVTEEERRGGVLYKCQGWKLLSRSSVYILNPANKSFKAPGAVGAATDSEGVLFWNKNMAEKAWGEVKAFENIGDPTWYGDIYSFLTRMGGRARRKNYEGIGVLMQAPTA